jgi:4-methyl-5(b-hydroxyethyl)-thiazole monophosphate biosynthesis
MKGIIVFSHDMEDVESLATKALLSRAGIVMDALTFEDTKDIKTAFNQSVKADYFMDEIDLSSYDFVVIPGGKYVAKVVDEDINIKYIATYFYQQNKLVAAICAGPRFLGQAGLLDGKKFTCYSGSEIDMPKGEYLPNFKAFRDDNIITARGAGAVYDFAYEIVKYVYDKDKAENLLKNILF